MQASMFWGQQGLHLKRVKEDILHKYPKAIQSLARLTHPWRDVYTIPTTTPLSHSTDTRPKAERGGNSPSTTQLP